MENNNPITAVTEIFKQQEEFYKAFLKLITDATGITSGVEFGGAIISTWKKTNFLSFLETLTIEIDYNQLNKEEINKLQNYIKEPKNLNYIMQTIDSAINGRSIKCAALLGTYTGRILRHEKTLQYTDYIIINALKNMIDEDLINFKILYERLFNDEYEKAYRLTDMSDNFNEYNIDEVIFTTEKLKNSNVLAYDHGGYGSLGNAWSVFVFHPNSTVLYGLIKQMDV